MPLGGWIRRLRARRVRRVIEKSGLFDPAYYATAYGTQANGLRPIDHYLQLGWRKGNKPNPLFDPSWYLERYPGVAAAGREPLSHYLQRGASAGHDPGPDFDTGWYCKRYPDVVRAGANPLAHYLQWGRLEGRAPRPHRPLGEFTGQLTPFESWLAVNDLSMADEHELCERLKTAGANLPTLSVVVPVFNAKPEFLDALFASLRFQLHGEWEAIFIDDASSNDNILPMLNGFAEADTRVRVLALQANAGISGATNAGAEVAKGEVLVFADHDDLLAPDCLAELALYYAEHPEADLVYSDDDKIDHEGHRYAPQFKPDWSPTLLLSWMYLSHVVSVRRTLFRAVGGLRPEFDGAQDHDFVLRATELARHVGHIPRILYHWRASEGSTARSADAKPESVERGRKAVEQAIARGRLDGVAVKQASWAAQAKAAAFELVHPDVGASVSLIIPVLDAGKLGSCLDALASTSLQHFDLVLVCAEGAARTVAELARPWGDRCRVVPADGSMWANLAAMKNKAAEVCSSDFLLFLDQRLEPTSPDWLAQMVGYGSFPGVGVVGPRLSSSTETIVQAGAVLGSPPGHVLRAFEKLPETAPGPLGLAATSRECSLVAPECMLTPRALFEELEGFTASEFPAVYHAADYCLRAGDAGWRTLYCAGATLRLVNEREESTTAHLAERSAFRTKYRTRQDPYHNFNLDRQDRAFEIAAVRPESRRTAPVRLLAVSHNLGQEGAPKTLHDLICGLSGKRVIDATIVSPTDGPLRQEYEAAGIPVVVRPDLVESLAASSQPELALRSIGQAFVELGAELVLGNTLLSYWAIASAHASGLPSLWAQHESEPWATYFDHLAGPLREIAYRSFAYPYRVITVAEATRRAWQPVETRRNFQVIRHGIPADRLRRDVDRWTREQARRKLRVPAGVQVFTVVGTVTERKGQLDLVQAFRELDPSLQARSIVFLAGRIASPDYAAEITRAAADCSSNIVLTGEIEDPFLYLRASDVAVCTSRIESAPRVLLEAMACALPIITTPVFGIPEMVAEGVNALFYEPGDVAVLANAMTGLHDDQRRAMLAAASPLVLASLPDFDDMVDGYAKAIRQAVNLRLVV